MVRIRCISMIQSFRFVGVVHARVMRSHTLWPIHFPVECEELLRRVCQYCAPPSSTAWDLLHLADQPTSESFPKNSFRRRRHIPTMLRRLDEHLQGGIRVGTLTELVGRAGAAKTQLAFQVCVTAAYALGKGSIYIDTEQKMSLARLREMATLQQPSRERPTQDGPGEAGLHLQATDVLNNLTVHTPTSTEDLVAILKSLDDEILLRNQEAAETYTETQASSHCSSRTVLPVGLVVVDSIAAPARRDFGSGSAPERAAAMITCAQLLKRMADEHQMAVIVINQIGSTSGNRSIHDNHNVEQKQQAALGTSWHHCVSTRMLMENLEELPGGSDGSAVATPHPHRRHIRVIKSNVVGQGDPIPFQVSSLGVIDVADVMEATNAQTHA